MLLTPDFRPRALLDAAMDAAAVGYGEHVEVTDAQVAQAIVDWGGPGGASRVGRPNHAAMEARRSHAGGHSVG
ncbi:hypothetical protein [Saccharopolyspora pogona]|uniref:hypothetical protein n=1 Tax=Saccharopolyspora pogona TaxID=333966 RepID=UPI001683E53F|nr:hypothetical protein [Saccharopolyspora pogona]